MFQKISIFFLFILYFTSQVFSQNLVNNQESFYNKSQFYAGKTTGNIAEKVMDGFFVPEWIKRNGMVGIQGIDGLYIKTGSDGVVQDVMVVESKYNTSGLGITKHGPQMSKEWITAKLDSILHNLDEQIKTAALNDDLNKIKELQSSQREYRQIKQHVLNDNYRGRLFHAEIIDSKISISIQDISTDGKIINTTRGQPTQVSLIDPPNTSYERRIQNQFFSNYQDELIKNGFTPSEAKSIVSEAKSAFKSKKITSSAEFHQFNRDKYIKLFDSKILNATNRSAKLYFSILKKNLQAETIIAEKYRNAAHSGMQAAIVSSLISMVYNGYQVVEGEMDIGQAALRIFQDGSLAGGSIFVSEAIMVNMGDKYAIQAMVPHGTAINLGLATFIFDEAGILFDYSTGSIEGSEFFSRSNETILKAGISYLATYCSLALKLTSSGPFIMAISVGGYILATQGIEYFKKMDSRSYLTYDDLLGKVPINIKNRRTLYNAVEQSDRKTIFNAFNRSGKESIYEVQPNTSNIYNSDLDSHRKTIYNSGN